MHEEEEEEEKNGHFVKHCIRMRDTMPKSFSGVASNETQETTIIVENKRFTNVQLFCVFPVPFYRSIWFARVCAGIMHE